MASAGGPLGVYFLDVGQGDCSFVLPPANDGAVLFDCNDAYVAGRFALDHGVKRLAAAVISHLDVDHIRGMVTFLRSFLEAGGHVGALYLGLDGPPAERLRPPATELLDQAFQWEKAGTLTIGSPTRELKPKPIHCGPGWNVDIVLPYARPIEVPCAGSIAVSLDGRGGWSVTPAPASWHEQLITTLDSPMCQ